MWFVCTHAIAFSKNILRLLLCQTLQERFDTLPITCCWLVLLINLLFSELMQCYIVKFILMPSTLVLHFRENVSCQTSIKFANSLYVDRMLSFPLVKYINLFFQNASRLSAYQFLKVHLIMHCLQPMCLKWKFHVIPSILAIFLTIVPLIDRTDRKVGDAGLSWVKKAYERAKEQAEEQGRSLEDVVAERFGVGLFEYCL